MSIKYVYDILVGDVVPTAVYVDSTQIFRLNVSGVDVIHKRQEQSFNIGLDTYVNCERRNEGSCGDYTDHLFLNSLEMRYYIIDKGDGSVTSAPSTVTWSGTISGYYSNDTHTGPDTSKLIFTANRGINLTTSYQNVPLAENHTLIGEDGSLDEMHIWLEWKGELSCSFSAADGLLNNTASYRRAGWKENYYKFTGAALFPTIWTQEY